MTLFDRAQTLHALHKAIIDQHFALTGSRGAAAAISKLEALRLAVESAPTEEAAYHLTLSSGLRLAEDQDGTLRVLESGPGGADLIDGAVEAVTYARLSLPYESGLTALRLAVQAALPPLPGSPAPMAQIGNAHFVLDRASTAAPNNKDIVAANGGGNWIRQPSPDAPSPHLFDRLQASGVVVHRLGVRSLVHRGCDERLINHLPIERPLQVFGFLMTRPHALDRVAGALVGLRAGAYELLLDSTPIDLSAVVPVEDTVAAHRAAVILFDPVNIRPHTTMVAIVRNDHGEPFEASGVFLAVDLDVVLSNFMADRRPGT